MKFPWIRSFAVLAALAPAFGGALLVAQVPSPAPAPVSAPAKTYTVTDGKRIPLTLENELNTGTVRPGDPVFCVSKFPIVREGAAGNGVRRHLCSGGIDAVKRPGRVKGRAELEFTTLILPNGVELSLSTHPSPMHRAW